MPAPPPGQAYLGVDPANPMDEQNDLGCIGIDIGNHLMDHGADDALLQPCIGRGVGPNALEIGCEHGERCRIDGGRDRGGVMGGNLGFDLRHAGERRVPSRLQFAGRSRQAHRRRVRRGGPSRNGRRANAAATGQAHTR